MSVFSYKSLIIIILFLNICAVSSVFSEEKEMAALAPMASLGSFTEVEKHIVFSRLQEAISANYTLASQKSFEVALTQAFEELEYDECTEDQCFALIQQILQADNLFLFEMAREGNFTQLKLTRVDLDSNRLVKTAFCEGCDLNKLNARVETLVQKILWNSVKLKNNISSMDPIRIRSLLVGQKTPDFEISSLNGDKKVKLSDLKGTPVLLNFWSSWCQECRVEAKILESFHQQYEKVNAKVRVIGVAIQDNHENAILFSRKFGITYFLGLDDKAGNIAIDYGIYGVPESILIDPNGKIIFIQVGIISMSVLEKHFKPYL